MRRVRSLLLSLIMRSLALLISLAAVGCTSAEVRTYAIGGTVSGLSPGRSVELANGTDAVTVQADGRFAFADRAALHSTYTVSISSQPAGQQCQVEGATGQVRGAVELTVTCADEAARAGRPRWMFARSGRGTAAVSEAARPR